MHLNPQQEEVANHVEGRILTLAGPGSGKTKTLTERTGRLIRKGVNPVHLYISIAGLSYFFFSNTPTLSAIFGRDLSSATAKRARRRHVVDLVMQALRP